VGTAAKISIAIEAQTATLQKGFDEAKGAINSLAAGMSSSVAMGMAKFHAGLLAVQGTLATFQGAIASVRNAMGQLDAQSKMAQRLGADADQLVALGFAADLAGSSTDAFNSAIEKMQNNLGEAQAGNATAIAMFGQLGLSMSELKGLQADQVFAKIAEQIQLLGDDTHATKVAIDLFGKSGGELLPLLKGGAEGLNEMGNQAERMGLLFGDNRAAVEAANDAIDSMKKAWGAFVQQVAVAVAPALKAIADILTAIVSAFNRLVGRTTGVSGTFKTYESEAKKAALHIDKTVKETEKTATKAADKIKEAWKDIPKPSDYTTPAVGAVTRGSVASFSAIQEYERKKIDDERRHRDITSWLAKIDADIRRNAITIAPVSL